MHHKFELSSVFRALVAFPRVHSYTYKPLTGPPDAIRLLLLQPAPFLTSPIRCQVIETSCGHEKGGETDQRGYTALSYTWGDSSLNTRIEVDGRPSYVTRNAELALRHLRMQRKTLRLWADSLCIHQDDTEERNLQVAQMRSIYAAARETTVFLGEASEGSDALLSSIQRAIPSIKVSTTKSAVVKCLVKASAMRKVELVDEAYKILRRPYWVRIWIFQEIIVSDNPWIQCGSVKVPWEYFCQALIALLDSESKQFEPEYGSDPKSRLEDIYWERRAYRHAQGIAQKAPRWDMASNHEFEGRMKLLDLLVAKRGSKATDPRDMVFALAGIATKPQSWSPINITYEKSPSLVFMDVVKYLLAQDGNYEILSHAGKQQQNSKTPTKIPSWAPDWRIPSDYQNKIVDWVGIPPNIKDLVKANYACLEHRGVLACVGRKLDVIHAISDELSEATSSGRSIRRAIWDNKWHRRTLIDHGVLSDLGSVSHLFSRSHPLTYHRKLAKMKGEIFALVPRDAQEGDIICQLVGSRIPFILRPLKENQRKPKETASFFSQVTSKILTWIFWLRKSEFDNEDIDAEVLKALEEKDAKNATIAVEHYSFIGESYVDGLMDAGSEIKQVGRENQNIAFVLH